MSDAVRPVAAAAATRPDAPARDRRRITPMQLWWSFVVLFELGFFLFVLGMSTQNPNFTLDYRWHMEASRRLLDTGTPYHAYQLAGPYSLQEGLIPAIGAPILYPPIAFALFIPFLWLPALLWWAIPITILVFCMTRHRPPLWGWALTGACFCWLPSIGVYIFGNPGMWIAAFVAAGTVWSWPFVLVLLKPTFAPIALLGATHRSWWVALAVLGAISVLFWPVWFDWFTILDNADLTLGYNTPTVPLMVAPLIPWLLDPRHPIRGWVARRLVRGAAPAPA